MSDLKKAINALKKTSENFNKDILKVFDRFNKDFSKALSSLEKSAVPSTGQKILSGSADLKTSIRQLFENQKSIKLEDIKKSVRAKSLAEIKPDVEELIKEGILKADEPTLGRGKKIIGPTIIHAGNLPSSIRSVTNDTKFLGVSREEYNRLVPSSPVAPYVEIETLRNRVTERLHITPDDFNRILLKLHTENPAKIQLDPGTGKSGRGIVAPRGVCYFVIIR